MRPKIIVYDDCYRDQLEELLIGFSKEIYGEGTAFVNDFVNSHHYIYLAVVGEEVVGFASFHHNTYFGMRKPTMGMTYLYVKPEYRNGRASYLLAMQIGSVCDHMNMDMETYLASEETQRIVKRMDNGEFLYSVYVFPVEEVRKTFRELKKHIKLEE